LYFAYVIKSEVADFYYKGHCSDLDRRLAQHNAGNTVSIRRHIPFKLIYAEPFETRQEAIARERYFKSAAGRRFLKTVLDRSTDTSDKATNITEVL
jgi:putative endonuclease